MKTSLVFTFIFIFFIEFIFAQTQINSDNTDPFNVSDGSGPINFTILSGNNTSSSFSRAPNINFKFQRTEYLITQAEIAASGFPSGTDVNSISFCIDTAGIGSTQGTLKVYLKNTTDVMYSLGANWTTSGFTQTCNLTDWSVPVSTGWYSISFSGGSTFIYTGGGLYIAWEYSTTGTAGIKAVQHRCNSLLSNGLYGGRSNSVMPSALGVSSLRPATMISSSQIHDIIAVSNIFALEKAPIPMANPAPVGVRVSNVSAAGQTFEVTLTIKSATTSAIRFIESQTVADLPANSSQIVNFQNWFPLVEENVTIEATTSTIAGESYTINNTLSTVSTINNNTFSYNYAFTGTTGLGFSFPASGIFATKFTMNGTGLVHSVSVGLNNDPASIGNTVFAVAINSAGNIVAQSGNYLIAPGDPGTSKTFAFIQPVPFTSEIFYVGFAQTSGSAQWHPLAGKQEIPLRSNTFYTFPLSGGTPAGYGNDYKFCIDAHVTVPAHDVGISELDPVQVFPYGTSLPVASVRNYGTNAESFSVTMTIGTYTSTKTVTSLPPGTTIQLTFDPWSHPASGDYTLNVCTLLSGDQVPANNCRSKSLRVINLNKTVYAYNSFPGTGSDPAGPIRFNLGNPGILTSIANQSNQSSLTGGTWANGYWYGCEQASASAWHLVKVNPNTGYRTVVGNMGVKITGLSYSTLDSTLYGVNELNLYSININTGLATQKGSNIGISLTGLAINLYGQAYGIDVNGDVLGSINLTTGLFSPIGPLGFNANLEQDIEFDRETGNLFLTSYGTQGALRLVDVTLGNSMLIGMFEGGAEVTGFAIPYFVTLPVVSTTSVHGITQISANCGGNVTASGGAPVTQKGLCWSTSPNPSIAGNHTINGTGGGVFSSAMTGLSPCTSYHVRAYAINSAGISYGADSLFGTICINTDSVTNITPNSAFSGGNITSGGSSPISARGVCWSVDSLPTTTNTHTSNGVGTGNFTSILTGLTAGNYYYIRAYATNGQGTFYGNQKRFRVYKLASVSSINTSNITSASAQSGGNIIADGYPSITEKGVCWSTTPNPTIANGHTHDGSGPSSYLSTITGLQPETDYYLRAYVSNLPAGTSYGNQVSFRTLPTACLPNVITGDKTYITLMIGEKCWMKENLNTGAMITGSVNQSNNSTIEKYCIDNLPANCDVYGGLYQWGEAVQYINGASNTGTWNPAPTGSIQGVCPQNWHIPSDAEWTDLSTYLGGTPLAGGKLKETGYTHWSPPNTGASNSSGFTGLPGGSRYSDGTLFDMGYFGYLWSSTPNDNLNSWSRILSFNNAKLERYNGMKTNGFSVRCVKNNLPPPTVLTVQNDTVKTSEQGCFNALQTITVAGSGSSFLVQNGGSVNFIAGEKIRFLAGTRVFNGGYLHGYISSTGSYCATAVIGKEAVNEPGQVDQPGLSSAGSILIYPNPTSDFIHIEFPGNHPVRSCAISIFDLYGKQLACLPFIAGSGQTISLAEYSPGVYIIKVSSAHITTSAMVVRQ